MQISWPPMLQASPSEHSLAECLWGNRCPSEASGSPSGIADAGLPTCCLVTGPVVLGLILTPVSSPGPPSRPHQSRPLPLPPPLHPAMGPLTHPEPGHGAPMTVITPSNCSLAPRATFGYHRGCRSHSSASSVPGPRGQLRNGGN